MNKIIEGFKSVLHKGMIENFEKDGRITPILFFIKDNQPIITTIPNKFFATQEGKCQLGDTIRNICLTPNVFAAGMIFEAYGAKMNKEDGICKLINDGAIKVSELKNKEDIIILLFSTPEGEDSISYVVDVNNKTVGEKFVSAENSVGGIFSNFFKWGMN